ncbi:MAG: hypothetical protein IJC78_03820 [Clostridia bacterium]|nr:hypothetical protein [Clostridia bacterium]
MKKLFSMVLSIAMIMSVACFAVSAADVTISDLAELQAFAADVNSGNSYAGKTVVLDADINLGGAEWTPIAKATRIGTGFSGNVFSGTFDGQNHEITGLVITTVSGDDTAGFFGAVSGGTVKNLKFVDVNVNVPEGENAGAAVGAMAGGLVDGITVSGSVTGKAAVGGVVGRVLAIGTVQNCVNSATVVQTGKNDSAGGVVGKAYYTSLDGIMEIKNCKNSGSVTSQYAAGGIVGFCAGNVTDCENSGVVTGGDSAGGIVGEQTTWGTVSGNENSGAIYGKNALSAVGGIVGWVRYQDDANNYPRVDTVVVKDNKNTASIEGGRAAGGIAGMAHDQIIITGNKNSAASIAANNTTVDSAGGILGASATGQGYIVPNAVSTVSYNVSITPIENITSATGREALYYNEGNVQFDAVSATTNIVKAVATADGVNYDDLAKAVAAGGTVELFENVTLDETIVIDKDVILNGNGYTVAGKDGENFVSDGVTAFEINNAAVTINNLTVKGGSLTSADGTLACNNSAGDGIVANGATLNIVDSTVIGGDMTVNGGLTGSAIKAFDSDVTVSGSTLKSGAASNVGYGVVGYPTINTDEESEITISDTELYHSESTGYYEGAVDMISVTSDWGDISSRDNEVEMYGTITVLEGSAPLKNSNIEVPAGKTIEFIGAIDDSIEVPADTIILDFVEKDSKEDELRYNIVLKAANGETINRLNTVDLTFVLKQGATGKNTYEIVESNDEVEINMVNNDVNRYEFHYEDKDADVDTHIGKDIIIGEVVISGYGEFVFGANIGATTNAAHATTKVDNIVTDFVPNGKIEDGNGEFVIDKNDIKEAIEVPTRDLTINIDFPNSVKNNPKAYQDMTVVVSGDDLADVVIDLGDDNNGAAITADNRPDAKYTVEFVNGKYVVTVIDALTVHTSYDITVSGAGYRTARYTVRMTFDKVVNFWNNVKDADADVEVGEMQAKKNFLAGDIVKDNKINTYDLSAVVSYFGETGLSATNNKAYAKYDLNRDGFIDSKDVAIVLVSWGE